ncbi:MAG: hypothetical protein K0T01_1790 [Acidimicrobiia bacterium]|jgi:hypothetical protein|nr:hypothetical protein [Acidimicrobiia bacterium]
MQTPENADLTITSAGDVGDPATVTVNAPGETLTGFIDFLLPSTLILTSTVETRLEQTATWNNVSAEACP